MSGTGETTRYLGARVQNGEVEGAVRTSAASLLSSWRRILETLKPWLSRCWQRSAARPVRLKLIERMPLAPKQTLALVEADGVRLLVATSAEGAAAFFALEDQTRNPEAQLKAVEPKSETLGWRRGSRRSW